MFKRKTLEVIDESREIIQELRRIAERLAVYADDLEHRNENGKDCNGGEQADRAS
jgi:hypothetical protein